MPAILPKTSVVAAGFARRRSLELTVRATSCEIVMAPRSGAGFRAMSALERT